MGLDMWLYQRWNDGWCMLINIATFIVGRGHRFYIMKNILTKEIQYIYSSKIIMDGEHFNIGFTMKPNKEAEISIETDIRDPDVVKSMTVKSVGELNKKMGEIQPSINKMRYGCITMVVLNMDA
jgi:hypothetical protein